MMLSTGAVARLIGVPEARIQHIIRRGRVCPAPTVAAGRRSWAHGQVLQVARELEVLDPATEAAIDAAFAAESTP